MTMEREARPGVWGKDARPGQLVRVLPGGAKVYNLGAAFIPITGENHRLRREMGLE